jgi:hypothetical protein
MIISNKQELTTMKKRFFICCLAFVAFSVHAQQKIKDGTDTPTSVGANCEAFISPTVVTTLVARCTIISVVSTQFGVYARSNISVTTLP